MAGQYSPLGTSLCLECPDGYYTTASAQASCTMCTAGNYCPAKNTGPQTCATGYYSLDAATACIPCPGGYDCSNQAGALTVCLAGTYSNNATGGCINCPVGSYCPTNGLTEHIPCAAGWFQTSAQQTSCTECGQGYKCPSRTATQTACPAGRCCCFFSPISL